MVEFAAVSAGVLALIATTGCAWMFGPCGLSGCPQGIQYMSLPPRDNPLALALATPTDGQQVFSVLSAAVSAQSGESANALCSEAAVAGCRYDIAVRTKRVYVGRIEDAGCSVLKVTVAGGGRSIRLLLFAGLTDAAAIPSGCPKE